MRNPDLFKKQVNDAADNALVALSDLFVWLDRRDAQPTNNIITLLEQVQEIEKCIQNALARVQQATEKKEELVLIQSKVRDKESVSNYQNHLVYFLFRN